MKKALLIEDDWDISQVISGHLERLGFQTQHVGLAREGLLFGRSNDFQLIILDLMLPDGDGLDICKTLRKERIQTPILILSGKNDEIDIVLGLELGADDYICKPFRAREFDARIKAVTRRKTQLQSPFPEVDSQPIVHGNLEIDRASRTVRNLKQLVHLTPKEYDMLLLLASHPGKTFSRSQLIDLVWGYQYQGFEHTVNSLINRLRAKIETDPAKPVFIGTVWGHGYRFNSAIEKSVPISEHSF